MTGLSNMGTPKNSCYRVCNYVSSASSINMDNIFNSYENLNPFINTDDIVNINTVNTLNKYEKLISPVRLENNISKNFNINKEVVRKLNFDDLINNISITSKIKINKNYLIEGLKVSSIFFFMSFLGYIVSKGWSISFFTMGLSSIISNCYLHYKEEELEEKSKFLKRLFHIFKKYYSLMVFLILFNLLISKYKISLVLSLAIGFIYGCSIERKLEEL